MKRVRILIVEDDHETEFTLDQLNLELFQMVHLILNVNSMVARENPIQGWCRKLTEPMQPINPVILFGSCAGVQRSESGLL